MTPKEHLLSGIAMKPTERIPAIILSSGIWTAYRHGLTLQDVFELHPEKIADIIINDNEKVGSDVIWVAADCSNVLIHALGGKCTFNLLGEASTIDEPLISTPSDVDKLKITDLENSPEIENLLKITRIVADKAGKEYLVAVSQWGPFTMAGQLLGMDKMMVTSLKDKPGIKHLLEFTERLLLKYWNLFIDAGVEMVNQAEPLSSGDVISSKLFRELSFPAITSANQKISPRGKAKMLHICGNTSKVLELIPQTGTDLYSMDYKVDLKLAREKLSGKVAFGGQLDPISIIQDETPEKIATATETCIKDSGQNGFVLMPGCDISPRTKMENVQAMIRTAHNYQNKTFKE